MSAKEVADYVVGLERQARELDDLAGEMIATLEVNRLRGTIRSDDEKVFSQLIEGWKRRRSRATAPAETPKRERRTPSLFEA